MSNQIDYYFTAISPFMYLGHNTLMSIAKKHGKEVRFKPFNLMGVWGNSGAVLPAERPPVRQRYRLIELQRVAEFRGMSINPNPAHFPTNPAAADHCICALVISGQDPSGLVSRLGKAVWEENLQIADEAVLGEILSNEGHDADAVLALSKSDKVIEMREENTEAAISADAIGAPSYVYNNEVFWGQDRLEYLDHMIASGRPAFSATV